MTKHTEKGRRLAAAIAGGRKPSGTLPAALRREVVAYVRERIAAGAWRSGIARELGVSMGTIDRWLSQPVDVSPARVAPKLRGVRVAESRAQSEQAALVMTTASGVRIDGLAVEDIVTILRGLG